MHTVGLTTAQIFGAYLARRLYSKGLTLTPRQTCNFEYSEQTWPIQMPDALSEITIIKNNTYYSLGIKTEHS